MPLILFTTLLSITAILTNSSLEPLNIQLLDINRLEVNYEPLERDLCGLSSVVCDNQKMFTVTAYNTVHSQTWGNPCLSASGDNICGRDDVVACPRKYPFGTKFVIEGKEYVCLDRLATKYDNRVDISMDKDLKEAREWGKRYLQVQILSPEL